MSCARIRARIPATTSELPCNSEFAPGSASYPTPLLHLRGEVPEDSQQQMAQGTAIDYAHALSAWKEAGTRLERLQKALLQHFEGAKVEELATDHGTLRARRRLYPGTGHDRSPANQSTSDHKSHHGTQRYAN